MVKYLALILFPAIVLAQNTISPTYVSLANTKVYDVEIIVFAYNKTLPNTQTYNNHQVFDDANAVVLKKSPTSQPLIKEKPKNTNNQYSIPINDNSKNNKQALVWFEHNKKHFKLTDIWKKLQNNNNTKPLLHRAWRQPKTPFETPQYVQVSTASANINNTLPEFAVTGMVALSKGRFLHFGHRLNLFRQYQSAGEIKNMVFALTERKQLHSGELHYYDSPWFGSIVKITKVTGKTQNEE